ncbi:MAG TPA: penicillin-insensitive murein endopeptidase [Polyangium sp.]|nr:penicillin-insensitive murein endopeptidase [Polyangium sp.]
MWRWLMLVLLIAPACGASAAPPPKNVGAVAPPPVSADKPTPPPPASAPTTSPAPVQIIVAGETPSADPTQPPPSSYPELNDDHDDELDDDNDDEETADAPTPPPVQEPVVKSIRPAQPTSPLLALSAADLEKRYKKDPTSVGPLALGTPNAGALVNGVPMPKSDKWIVQDPSCAWGTQETIDQIVRTIEKVYAEHANSPPLAIGHISSKRGGHLSPHKSHQSGRDVDLGYYHSPPKQYFVKGTEQNLDLERTYALIKAFVTDTETDLILVDTSIQRMLVKYALSHGEDEAFVDRVFQVRDKHPRPYVRHARGHANHVHVRFSSPIAQTLGRRAETFLKREKVAPPHVGQTYVMHKARNGDTLVMLAKHYATTVEAIQSANSLKSIDLKIGRTYKIPVPKAPTPPPAAGKPSGKQPPKGKGKTPTPPTKGSSKTSGHRK